MMERVTFYVPGTDTVIGYGNYQGSADIMCSNIFKTKEERQQFWKDIHERRGEWKACRCFDPVITEVEFCIDGLGRWGGGACLPCGYLFPGPSDLDNY